MSNLSTKIGSVQLANPIMPASGTFSEDLAQVFDLNRLGALVAKTITREIRNGNPTPRICEVRGSMMNAIGIPSKGVDYFRKNSLPFYAQFTPPLVASISAPSVDEFARICEEITMPGVTAIEVNISCPNIEEDGKAFAMRPSTALAVMKKLRSATDLPLWAKLTPNTGEPAEVAQACEEGGANAVVTANTLLAMAVDIRTRKPKLGNVMGGLSGPSLKPINLRMTYQCAKAVNIPVIGCGGIATLEDVLEYLMVGASAVQVGTSTFVNPTVMVDLVDQLDAYMRENHINDLSEIIGSVRDKEAADAVFFQEAAE